MKMINRRQFLEMAGTGAVGLMAGSISALIGLKNARAVSNPEGNFVPDLDIALKAAPAEVPILSGNPTGVW
jgi:hypothetical protein